MPHADESGSPQATLSLHTVTRGVLLYLVLGSLWIILSDRLAGGPAAQTVKGLSFVGVTALLFYLAARGWAWKAVRAEIARRQAVSGQVQSQAALAESERRFLRLAEETRDIVVRYRLTPEPGFEYVNEAVTSVVGYTPREHYDDPELGRTIVHPDDRPELAKMFTDLIPGQPRTFTLRWIHRDGRTIWVEQQVVAVADEQGNVVALEAIGRDITERKQLEEELRRLSRQLEGVIESSPLAMLVVNEAGRVRQVNSAAERLFDRSRGELVGYNHPLPIVGEAGIWRSEGIEVELKGPDASPPRRVQVWAAPLKGVWESGTVLMARDITDQHALQQQFLQAQRMESIGRLSGAVAHDFNNLLTAILGRVELLRHRGGWDEKERKGLEAIWQSAQRASGLTRQLLGFARGHEGNPAPVELNKIITTMLPILNTMTGDRIQLEVGLSDSGGVVRADPVHLEQIIMNLTINACEAMPQGGRLTLKTACRDLDESFARHHLGIKPGPYIEMMVSDTGHGMSDEVRSMVFEPFFTTKQDGTGLGLSTVYSIARQAGGQVWVYSEPEQGTVFKVLLPLIEYQPAEGTVEETGEVPGGSETILLVEDDELVRELARETLTLAGYRVLPAADGESALGLADSEQAGIDLLVSDVMLPGMRGNEVVERIRAQQPDLKVVLMSGYSDEMLDLAGADGLHLAFLAKPFAPRALLELVRSMLDAPREAPTV